MKRKLQNKVLIGTLLLAIMVPVITRASIDDFDKTLRQVMLAREKNEKPELINQLKKLGSIYLQSDNCAEAKKVFREGSILSIESNDSNNEAYFELELGLIEQKKNNYYEALKQMLWAEYLLKNSGNYYLVIKVEKSLSQLYTLMLDNTKALEHILKANSLLKYIDSKKIKFTIFQNTANLYSYLNNLDSCLVYVNKAIEILGSDTTTPTFARLNVTIGDYYMNQIKDSIAINYYKKAYKISLASFDNGLMAHIAYCLSIAFMNLENYVESENWINQAIENAVSKNDYLSKNIYIEQLALLKFNQKKFNESVAFLNEVIKFYEEQKLDYYLQSSYPLLIDALTKLGLNSLANQYYLKSIELNSSLHDKQNKQLMTLFNTKIKAEENLKDTIQELELLKIKHQQLISYLIFGLTLLFLLVIVFYGRKFYLRKLLISNQLLQKESIRKKAISDLLVNDIKNLLLPVSIFIAQNADKDEHNVATSYSKATHKLNQILSEVKNY